MNKMQSSECGDAIPAMPKHETPGFRLAEHSPDYLSDTELLSLLLKGYASSEKSLQIARKAIAACGGISNLSKLSYAELRNLPGIGECGAGAILSALTLARRLHRGDPTDKPVMNDPRTVAEHIWPVIGHLQQEEFHVLLLNTKHRLIRGFMVTRGLVDSAQVHAREVFRPAIQESCSRVILTHNHPSGDPKPSPHDMATTAKMVEAGKIIGIDVLDHVIIGKPEEDRQFWFSMRGNGLIT